MKATGIVRRIDELGRVIPKEIRRTLRIREGDPPKYLPIVKAKSFSKNILPSANGRRRLAACRIAALWGMWPLSPTAT